MPTCYRILGMGMSHIHALILSLAYSVDTMIWVVVEDGLESDGKPTKGEGFQNRLTPEKIILKRVGSLSVCLARIFVIFLIPRWNNKYILLVLCSVEIPFIVLAKTLNSAFGRTGMLFDFCVLKIVQSLRWPLMANILSKWSTYKKMTFLFCLMECATRFVNSLLVMIEGALVRRGSPKVLTNLYVAITVKVSFCVLLLVFGSQEPFHSIYVSPGELAELREEHRFRTKTSWKARNIPFKGFLKTPILYGCIFWELTNKWHRDAWETSSMVDPMAMFSETGSVGMLMAHYVYLVACLAFSYIVDEALRRDWMDVNDLRKISATLTAFGCGCSFLLMGFALDSQWFTVWLVFYNIFRVPNFFYDGCLVEFSFSPNYLGIVYSALSSIAYASVIFIPELELFLFDTGGLQNFIYFHGFSLIFGCLIMQVSGHCRRRDYDLQGTVPWKPQSFVSIP